jgi:hemoglobin
MNEDASLYEAIGGEPLVAKAVDEFYLRVFANPKLAAFFAHTTLDELKNHQRAFLTLLLRGPNHYTGRSMHEAHAGRGIADADFDRMVHHLADTFRTIGVDESLIRRILAEVEPLRAEIVGSAR